MSKRRRRRPEGLPKAQIPVALLVLAATDRAIRHLAGLQQGTLTRSGGRSPSAAPAFLIAEHLGYSHGTNLRRGLRNRLDELTRDGLLEAHREVDLPVWRLTEKGRTRIGRYRRRAWAELPESPQHRAWREARETAEQQIDALRAGALSVLETAATLLERELHDGAELLAMGDRLRDAFGRLAGASYCLSEWTEPDDIRADIDVRVTSAALRNPASWAVSAS